MTGNAENIYKALSNPLDLAKYLNNTGISQIQADITAYGQSIRAEQKQPDRVEMEKSYDMYASAALQALISKLPLIDRDGEFSEKASQESIINVKKEIARSAHDYAVFMIESRKEFVDYLNALKQTP
jgi:hypothetical protein